MPDVLPNILSPLYKCTKAKIRHAYSCCIHAYTMAFWGKKEWRKDLDWLALNGVNVIFDITAQEEVWRRFLSKIGYSHEEIRRFVAGPAYCGWAVKNLYGFGEKYKKQCRDVLLNNLCVFADDGFASAGYLVPYLVEQYSANECTNICMKPQISYSHGYDDYANDQDWGLYFYLRKHGRSIE